MASPFLRNFYLLKETRTMTPEVQQYLLAGFLLLAAVFAVPLLKRILTPVKKRISDRIPALVGHLLRCFLRPAAWLVRVTLAGWALLTIPWSAEIRVVLTRAMRTTRRLCWRWRRGAYGKQFRLFGKCCIVIHTLISRKTTKRCHAFSRMDAEQSSL